LSGDATPVPAGVKQKLAKQKAEIEHPCASECIPPTLLASARQAVLKFVFEDDEEDVKSKS
jgi:hypothetical protein